MRKYLEIAKIAFKTQLTWRFDIAFNMVFTIIKILFAYIIWGTIFGEREFVAGFTFHTMLSYYIISSFLSQVEMSDGVSREINTRIRTGTFSKYMTIPANVEGYFIAQTAGTSAFYLLFNFTAAVIWIFIFRIKFVITTNIAFILPASFMIILGLLFMVQLNFFLGILTLKFQDIQLFLMIKNSLIAFITGTMLPLSLLPEGIITVMRFFPFYYITYLPSMLLIGQNETEITTGLCVLTIWLLLFVIINKLTYRRLRVRFDGVGV